MARLHRAYQRGHEVGPVVPTLKHTRKVADLLCRVAAHLAPRVAEEQDLVNSVLSNCSFLCQKWDPGENGFDAFLSATDSGPKAVERAGNLGDEVRRHVGEGLADRRKLLDRVAIGLGLLRMIAVG